MVPRTDSQLMDLMHLRSMLDRVVTTLAAVGADGYSDLSVSVGASQAGRPLGDLRIEAGRLHVTAAAQSGTLAGWPSRPDEIAACDGSGSEAAGVVLVGGFLHLLWLWDWDPRRAARYLGCDTVQIEAWLAHAANDEVPSLPEGLALRIRRLLIIEHLRVLAGIPDDSVRRWFAMAWAPLARRRPVALLSEGGDQGFRRIVAALLDAACGTKATVH